MTARQWAVFGLILAAAAAMGFLGAILIFRPAS